MTQNYDTIVIGGGQAGLATGYYLKQQGRNFVILDGSEPIGDSWRARAVGFAAVVYAGAL